MPLTCPFLARPCSGRARLEDVASSNSLSASSTPAKFVVVSSPCSSRRVCSFARVLLGSFSVQAQQQRKRCASPRSSWSGFVFIFGRTVFGLGLLCLSFGTAASGSIHHISFSLCFFVQAAFGLRTPCLAVLLIGPILRPFDPAIFWCSTWARTAWGSGGAAAPPALKARKPTFDRAPWTYPRTFRLLHTLFRGGSLCRVLHLIYMTTYILTM